MYIKILYLASLLVTIHFFANAQRPITDANVVGHVVSNDEHLPFATISVVGTTIGTTTDQTGHFLLLNMPQGELTIRAQSIGYKPAEKKIIIKSGELVEVNFDLEPDVLGIEEVVVTSNRNEKNRRESAVIVNTITPKLFNVINSVSLSDGLNFSPGLRMETNCQNCGFNQVRMNGMEGSYSQILINGRPVFSGLVGVYGLELIPTSILERIEVVRGGGSALYGSNAIAGTINLILRDPIRNTFEFGVNSGITGAMIGSGENTAFDHSISGNASVVSDDSKSGMAIYGFYRDRSPFDANGDGISEMTAIQNTTFGARLFHRFGFRGKLSGDFFNIKENRRGGNMFDSPAHQADIAEALQHDITTGALTYEQFFRGTDLFSVYASGQRVLRDSYYGAGQSLADYGKTNGITLSVGSQYNLRLTGSNLIVGIDNKTEWLTDNKMGYPDWVNAVIVDGKIVSIPQAPNSVIARQTSNTAGIFAQYDKRINMLSLSVGGRFDNYNIHDNANNNSKTGNVFSPRLTLKYDILNELQARASYSQGYRAPQVFDEDLHIEASTTRHVLHRNSPDLKQETSHSFMVSVDFNKQLGNSYVGILAELFYTRLNDAFVSQYGTPDENGIIVHTRVNADEGAVVQGINTEFNITPSPYLSIKSGLTFQTSRYEKPHEFNERRFFRTPGQYGYITLDMTPTKRLSISSTGNYTGRMLIPYFGNTLDRPDEGELRLSPRFFDMGSLPVY